MGPLVLELVPVPTVIGSTPCATICVNDSTVANSMNNNFFIAFEFLVSNYLTAQKYKIIVLLANFETRNCIVL